MLKTTADRCLLDFNLIPRDEDYFCVPKFLDRFIRRWTERAEVSEESPESRDSAICLRFEDGSKLDICNPGQLCFYAFVRKA